MFDISISELSLVENDSHYLQPTSHCFAQQAPRSCHHIPVLYFSFQLDKPESILSIMAVLLYKYLKRKRSEPAENVGMEEIHQVSKPYELCVHQRDIIQAQSLELSELSSAPHEKVQDEAKEIANGPCVLCKDEKRAATKYRWKLVAGLCLPFAIQALDTTIVAGALPFIASDFRKFKLSPVLQSC